MEDIGDMKRHVFRRALLLLLFIMVQLRHQDCLLCSEINDTITNKKKRNFLSFFVFFFKLEATPASESRYSKGSPS